MFDLGIFPSVVTHDCSLIAATKQHAGQHKQSCTQGSKSFSSQNRQHLQALPEVAHPSQPRGKWQQVFTYLGIDIPCQIGKLKAAEHSLKQEPPPQAYRALHAKLQGAFRVAEPCLTRQGSCDT